MFNFDSERYLRIQKGALSLKDELDAAIDSMSEIKNIFFVGTGGAAILMYPAEYILKTYSTLPVFTEISSELMVMQHQHLNKHSLVIMPSLSGTTKETVAAAQFAREKGATTISLVGHADTPLAKLTDYTFVNFAKDDTSCESFYIQSYLIAFRLMYKRKEFPQYHQYIDEMKLLPDALLKVKEAAEQRASAFAQNHKRTSYHILSGAGVDWGQTYYYGMCILEEMQWIKTRPVHASDFFHGTLELVEKDTSLILLKGENRTRPLIERVERFAEHYSREVTVFDTKDYQLEGISEELRGLISPIVFASLLERVSCHLEAQRNHPLTTRRYYKKVPF
ncbi:SIS domain-containing protein [Paenibacillus sp. BSR1-1]|uniref:SIS domain-containing protein n=1 Tax=Paenibacillus sp. BSR1-1 TaxID=3020845 RepID=UPI0025B1A138|nr:SIS domain-containing protein [Paenibacillus sp. BSR1-1]MDN3017896.1 SIS domain-containing protein [Paenibacillus sp. BSR1-1]